MLLLAEIVAEPEPSGQIKLKHVVVASFPSKVFRDAPLGTDMLAPGLVKVFLLIAISSPTRGAPIFAAITYAVALLPKLVFREVCD